MNYASRIFRQVLLVISLGAWFGQIDAVQAAEGVKWSISLDQAKARAKTENKVIMVDFTGSKWCPGCIRMNKEVLSTKQFTDYAAKNLVYVEADFASPAYEPSGADDPVIKYGIEVFPTFLLLDSNGKEITRLIGYAEGGPEAFIAKLEHPKK